MQVVLIRKTLFESKGAHHTANSCREQSEKATCGAKLYAFQWDQQFNI